MNAFDRFERELPELLTELSVPRVPDYLDDILSQTARRRQRPGWTSLERWIPMDLAARAPVRVRSVPWRTVGILAILALLIALAVATVGSQQRRTLAPFGPAANGALLYERGGDIYSTDLATGVETLLVGGTTEDQVPTWSNDGTRFSFRRGTNEDAAFVTADARGRDIRVAADHLAGASWWVWSPDGKDAVIYYEAAGDPVLAIVDPAGNRSIRKLDLGHIAAERRAFWRPPAGNELIFLGHPNGLQSSTGLYAIRPDGTGLRTIALDTNQGTDAKPGPLWFQDLYLSDDGLTAYFSNWEPEAAAGRTANHLVDLATGVDRRMSYDPTAASELRPLLTPDGSTIVFERLAAGEQAPAQIAVAPADGRGIARRIGPEIPFGKAHEFDISPDGMKVILVFEQDDPVVIDIATGVAEPAKVVVSSVPSWQRRLP